MLSMRLRPAVFALILLAPLTASADDYVAPTPATDPAMARNLQAMGAQPGVTDLEWRQPKEAVAGAATALPAVNASAFPSASALAEAKTISDGFQGIGMMVWYDGQLVASEFAEGVTPETHFSAFSMHKSLLSLAVLAAIEDGILGSLDDSVETYIPRWRDQPRGKITLRQLAHQISGLEHVAMTSGDARAGALVLSSQVSNTALTYELAHEPGTHFNYNNVNGQILGIALENALAGKGMRYSEYLSERLWKPLGNGDAALWMEADNGSPRYFSGMEAGLADWLRIGIMLLNEGAVGDTQVLSADSIATLNEASPLNEAYGLKVWRGADWTPQRRYGPTTPVTVVHSAPYLAPDVIYFDGFGGQRLYVVPSQKLVVARFGTTDMTFDDAGIVNALLQGLLDDRIAKARSAYESEESNAVYDQRFQQLLVEAQNGRGLASYDPLVPLEGSPEPSTLARGEAEWLDADTQNWLKELGESSNSQSIIVWHGGDIVYEDYFNGAAADSLVTSRSLSKPISVVAMGRAMEEGYIQSLDEPASKYITEWQGTDREGITLRHLLQMRSGLAMQGNSMEAEDVMNRAYLHPYHAEVIIHEYPLVNEPGSRYDYSNANSEIIAPILERATGRPYQEWLTEQVLTPLGAAGGQIWVNRIGGTAHAGCCALVPAETYLRLALLYHNDGVWEGERLLPEGYVDTISTPTEYNPHTGMGLYLAGPYVEGRGAANPDVPFGKTPHGEPYLDKDLWLFDGNSNQVVYVVPRHDLIVLRVGNRPPKDQPWDNSVLPNRLLKTLEKNAGVTLVPQAGS